MEIKQFEDINLAHFSYAVLSKGEIALIDPGRDPRPYYEFADQNGARIVAVIETHPHADFISSHLEIHRTTGATVYASRLLNPDYPCEGFDEGNAIILGGITLKALNTPGHSPDSISIVALDQQGKEKAVFTGDTLFIGDCGRPDLREQAGAITASRTELARIMYHSLRNKLMTLPDDVLVYPAHGAGSLCGKGLSNSTSSTIGAEKNGNWSLQQMSEADFVRELLAGQPFVPKYFPFAVSVNKKGAENFEERIAKVGRREPVSGPASARSLKPGVCVIDARPQEKFKKSHLKGAINLPNGTKFETWLGSIIAPGEKFYLAAESGPVLEELIARIAKIGYEGQVEEAFVMDYGDEETKGFDSEELRRHAGAFTIVDIRNPSEVQERKIFANALNIPLYELREHVKDIPLDKPIVVHCAGGYRSAAGSSIIKSELNGNVQVYDLGEAVKTFQK